MSAEGTKRVQEFISKINSSYDGGIVELGGKFDALNVKRFTSGVIRLDCALGGGWPFARVCTLAGEESTGKTYLALKACEEVENYDHMTKLHRTLVDAKDFEAGTALFVDVEGSFDPDWAEQVGFNHERHVVARPEYSEQAIDIVTAAIQENTFDLIVIDSVAAMTPSKEAEETTEKWQMGLSARINNKAMRKWQSALNKMSQEGILGPMVLSLNQFRIDITKMIGDPRTLPGGKQQRFSSAIIIYTTGTKVEDRGGVEQAYVKMGGVCMKNKTFVPKKNFRYAAALQDLDGWAKGQANSVFDLVELGKDFELIDTTKGVTFDGVKYKTQKEFKAKLQEDEALRRLLWRSVVSVAIGGTFTA